MGAGAVEGTENLRQDAAATGPEPAGGRRYLVSQAARSASVWRFVPSWYSGARRLA